MPRGIYGRPRQRLCTSEFQTAPFHFNHWQRSRRRSGKLEADTASDCHRTHYDLASRYCAKVETREKQSLMAASLHMGYERTWVAGDLSGFTESFCIVFLLGDYRGSS